MGVHGFTRILVEEGYLPPLPTEVSGCCSTSLWRDTVNPQSDLFEARIQTIPPGSKVCLEQWL
jgi:hypothetical protein